MVGTGHAKGGNYAAYGADESSSHPFRSKGKMDNLKAKGETIATTNFEVLPQFRLDADFPGEVLVRCTGSDFFVHRA